MKKITSFFVFSLMVVVSLAQITITDADMPNANDTIRLSETMDVQGLDPALTGTNYTWNYGVLTPVSQRIDTFFSVSSTPFAYQLYFNNNILYPNHKASFAKRGPDFPSIPLLTVDEVFNYTKNSSTAFDNVGFGSNINGIPSSTRNVPVDREYVFPMNYGDNHISNAAFDITIPGVMYYGQTLERIDSVDGWGTLNLPNGTYNVLRVKSILNIVDTTYIDMAGFGTTVPRTETEYKWLANGEGMPVLKIVVNGVGLTQIEYQDNFYVGLDEWNEINEINLFPNPVQSNLMVDFNAKNGGTVKVKLKDLLGKELGLIYTGQVTTGNNQLMIDIAKYNLKEGVYFVELFMDENQFYAKKIMVLE